MQNKMYNHNTCSGAARNAHSYLVIRALGIKWAWQDCAVKYGMIGIRYSKFVARYTYSASWCELRVKSSRGYFFFKLTRRQRSQNGEF